MTRWQYETVNGLAVPIKPDTAEALGLEHSLRLNSHYNRVDRDIQPVEAKIAELRAEADRLETELKPMLRIRKKLGRELRRLAGNDVFDVQPRSILFGRERA